MAYDAKLTCYTFQVREKDTVKEKHGHDLLKSVKFLGGEQLKNISFFEFFENFISAFDGKYAGLKGSPNVVYIPENSVNINSKDQLIYGFLKGGRTGIGLTIEDIDNPDEEIFVVTPEHVSSQEFFYLIYVPEDSNLGIIIVQGLSTISLATTFTRIFQKYFSDHTPGFIMEVLRYIPKDTIKKMKEDGDLYSVVLTKKRLDPDIANHVMGVNFIDQEITIKVSIEGLAPFTKNLKKIYNGDVKGLITDAMKGDPRFFVSKELSDIGMDGEHNVQYKFENDGKRAIARSDQGFEIAPNFYIDEDSIERNKITNLPTKESIEKYVLSFFKNVLLKELTPNVKD